jgi:hypothetical protein
VPMKLSFFFALFAATSPSTRRLLPACTQAVQVQADLALAAARCCAPAPPRCWCRLWRAPCRRARSSPRTWCTTTPSARSCRPSSRRTTRAAWCGARQASRSRRRRRLRP